MGIYNRKILRQKERKHAFDQQKSKILEKKERKHAFDQKKGTLEEKKKENKRETRFRPRKK